ncbi:amidase family protein [Pochonia chlamydosporia 170]|uniref:Amidase family protein n=1 Tax=Pochonia chlamydosporia 170 TaxID=1380566 RepID=A0A179FGV1_METCM|nr:amidase family protein [Pochonia chlamydosporia 170]OAQ64520.1 amidase family protein [Pochonia chlamydosporia 170]
MHITLTALFLGAAVAVASSAAQNTSIVEATIEQLHDALKSGRINSVQLVAKHLHRIAQYDRRGPHLNSIPVISPDIFEQALAADERYAKGCPRSILDGLPYTAKDSYMVKGLTVASGSPAFKNLTASEDAFTISQLRNAGAVFLGLTNMPPMANGGLQRGVYGRAESPYNKDYLAAAMGSGSSNGCGVSTAASMAVFGMAEETVSSGRSPASNNGLVAYTPSRGVLSIRGNWPLIPVADVVVPHTRSVKDMLTLLEFLTVKDERTEGDFWRMQKFVPLPDAEKVRPTTALARADSLRGKRIGVPRMFIGEKDPAAQKIWVNPQVRRLWDQARVTLEGLGAIVEETDFPLVTNHEVTPTNIQVKTEYPLPAYFNGSAGPEGLIGYGWDDFLRLVNDTVTGTKLIDVDPRLIAPQPPGTILDRPGNRFNNRTVSNYVTIMAVENRTESMSILDLPGLEAFVKELEARRKRDLEQWMEKKKLDAVVWPAVGDVGPQDAETNEEAAQFAWRNGVARSNGNYAIRQLGVPTVTVNMGFMEEKKMPVGLTFASKAYDDDRLFSYAFAFEAAHRQARVAPPRTPGLYADYIPGKPQFIAGREAPELSAEVERLSDNTLRVFGKVIAAKDAEIEVFVDGVLARPVEIVKNKWSVTASVVPPNEPSPYGGITVPDNKLAMVVVVCTAWGRSVGKLLFA